MKVSLRAAAYLRPYRRRIAGFYLALFAGLGLQLAVPRVLAAVIDDGIVARDEAALARGALLVVALAALQALAAAAQTSLATEVVERASRDLRDDLYAHLQRLPPAFYDRSPTGQLLSRAIDDVANVRAMLLVGLRSLVGAAVTLVAVAVILLRLDALLALVALAQVPPLVWWSARAGGALHAVLLEAQQQLGRVTSVLQEHLAGRRVVLAFAQDAAAGARFDAELARLFRLNLSADRRWAVFAALLPLLSGLGLGAVFWLGAHRVATGALSIGLLVAFNGYLLILAGPVQGLGGIGHPLARGIASAGRIFATLDARPAIADPPRPRQPPDPAGQVAFEQVTFTYPGASRPALIDASFTARPDETVAVVGPTGAGKSTIAHLLPRFADVAAGRILVDGVDLRDLSLPWLRRRIGTVGQDPFLFAATVRDNIAYGRPDATDAEVVAAARAAQAHEFIVRLPQGYDTELGERGVTLSGGQRQRLAVARAFLLDPRILILDDATSSLDPRTERGLLRALRRLTAGRTTLVITQRASTAWLADRIVVLRAGRVVARGTHGELLARDGFYRELIALHRHHGDGRRDEADPDVVARGDPRAAGLDDG